MFRLRLAFAPLQAQTSLWHGEAERSDSTAHVENKYRVNSSRRANKSAGSCPREAVENEQPGSHEPYSLQCLRHLEPSALPGPLRYMKAWSNTSNKARHATAMTTTVFRTVMIITSINIKIILIVTIVDICIPKDG